MPTINYLAYGSNLYRTRLAARIAIKGVRGVVELAGWALEFTKRGSDGSAKCTLRQDVGARAFGVVYQIDSADQPTLDRIEGVGHGYLVDSLELPPYGHCFFYRAERSAIDPGLQPFDWYKAYVHAGASAHRLPQSYLAQIAAVVAVIDPDATRRAEHLACLAQSEAC